MIMENRPIPPRHTVVATACYEPGQLVRHRRYGYRGVVVDFDQTCQAEDDWYQSNKTQPSRNQPWYHVLVHGTSQTTYAAQENLSPDDSGQPIAHPMLPYFFDELVDGKYVRNENG
jgi:heat shock protein HspQ